ncbi:hypothetical protein [Methanosarcina acetivorans]|uniref:Uncharacterized protein n=2 Tax=Methanosarcina acetivorans TaxID=2214 RepID=Q8TLK9_METAC|nr:hypothetical protein [Methanosarcina acetivorans]AAM06400.1 predicted protein [Methanosarcina acetivorans C2A]
MEKIEPSGDRIATHLHKQDNEPCFHCPEHELLKQARIFNCYLPELQSSIEFLNLELDSIIERTVDSSFLTVNE